MRTTPEAKKAEPRWLEACRSRGESRWRKSQANKEKPSREGECGNKIGAMCIASKIEGVGPVQLMPKIGKAKSRWSRP